jgi:hypothetical protein
MKYFFRKEKVLFMEKKLKDKIMEMFILGMRFILHVI